MLSPHSIRGRIFMLLKLNRTNASCRLMCLAAGGSHSSSVVVCGEGEGGPGVSAPSKAVLLPTRHFGLSKGSVQPQEWLGSTVLAWRKQCLKPYSPIWAGFHVAVQVLELGSSG